MNQEIDQGEQLAKYILGFGLHAILGSVGSLVFSMPLYAAIDAVVKPGPSDSPIFVSISISSVLIVFLLRFKAGDWVSCRWLSLTGPWVGFLGIAAPCLGLHDRFNHDFWSPILFASWTSYSAASLVALWIGRRRRSAA